MRVERARFVADRCRRGLPPPPATCPPKAEPPVLPLRRCRRRKDEGLKCQRLTPVRRQPLETFFVLLTGRLEYGDAAVAVVAADRGAHPGAGSGGNRDENLQRGGIGRHRMDAPLARKAGLRAPIFLAGLGVDDAEMLRIGAARFSEEVMAVAMVEPDLVAAVLIAQDMNDVAVVQIDDH